MYVPWTVTTWRPALCRPSRRRCRVCPARSRSRPCVSGQRVLAEGVDAQTEKNLRSLFDLAPFVIEAGRIPPVVTVVPTVSDFEETAVSPELVLVDPALRAQLAMRESVSPEIVEPPDAVAPIDVPAAVVVVPVVSAARVSSVRSRCLSIRPWVRTVQCTFVGGVPDVGGSWAPWLPLRCSPRPASASSVGLCRVTAERSPTLRARHRPRRSPCRKRPLQQHPRR